MKVAGTKKLIQLIQRDNRKSAVTEARHSNSSRLIPYLTSELHNSGMLKDSRVL